LIYSNEVKFFRRNYWCFKSKSSGCDAV